MIKYLKSLLAGLSFGLVSLLSLPALAETFSTTVNLRYHDSGRGQDGHNSLEFRIPLTQDTSNFFYFAPHLKVFNNGRFGSNLTFGYRSLNPTAKNILGGWLSYDNRDNGSNFFQQLAGGLELLAETFDITLNAALPIGSKRTFIGDSFPGTGTFDGTTLLIDRNRRFDEALTTVELQAGLIVPSGGDGYFRPFLGTYYLGSSQGGAVGGKAGLAYGGSIINASLGVQSDRIFGTSLLFSIGINFSPSSTPKYGQPPRLEDRMNEAIARNSTIAVENQFIKDSAPAINPETGQLYRYFVVSDNPAGLKGAPVLFPATDAGLTNALAQAGLDVNGVVYVYTANAPANFATPVNVPDGTKLVSSAAPQIPFNALFGVGGAPVPDLAIPHNVGTKPVTTGTITLNPGSSQGVVGFTVQPTDTIGIMGTNNVNPLIQFNHVNIQGNDNALATNAQGIFLTGSSGNVRVLNNQVNNALREGIRLDNVSGTALIAGNTVNGTRTAVATNNLESAIFVSNNTGFVDLTIRNNTVTNTLGNADGIEFNLCRFNGDTPIAGCAGGGSAIVRVQNNIISGTILGDGIDFNLLSGSQTIAEISGNILTGIADKGISFGPDGNALFAATIINNQITTDPTIATTDETRGISLNLGATANGVNGASPLTVGGITAQGTLISGNTINNTEQSGILLRTRNNAQLLATVSNNTVSNTNSTNDTDHAGIKIRTQGASSQTVIVENNTVNNSGVSGINIRAANTATARATVRGNTVTNTNTSNNANEAGILARSQDTARVCIRLENNSSLNPLSAADFRMRRQAGTAFLELFNLSSPIAVGAPSAPLQTFLTNAPQNNIGGNNKFFVTNNSVQVPTAGCTFP
jgi:hypothetical protein